MAFDYTNLYPDTSNNGAFTKSWNYTTVVDSVAVCSASGFFNKVATRLGIGDNIAIAQVNAFDKSRTTLIDFGTLLVSGISGGVVTTTAAVTGSSSSSPAVTIESAGGGIAKTSAQNTTAINSIIATGSGLQGVRILLGAGTYNCLPGILVTKQAVCFEGAGLAVSTLQFNPVADGVCIDCNAGIASGEINNISFHNLSLTAPDATFKKTMIKATSQTGMVIHNVLIGDTGLGGGILNGGTGGSIGLYTLGHQYLNVDNFYCYAENPIIFGKNPINYISADHYHLNKVVLQGDNTHPLIKYEAGVTIFNNVWDHLSGSRGTDGIYVDPAVVYNHVAAIVNPGSGYVVGEVITAAGGTFTQALQITVYAVGGGGTITGAAISRVGAYTVLPGNPVAQASTSGVGTGATFTLQIALASMGIHVVHGRLEQGLVPTGYNFNISAPTANFGLVIDNFTMDSSRKGIFARNIAGLSLKDIEFTGTDALNADATVDPILGANVKFRTGSTTTITGQTTLYDGGTPTGYAYPAYFFLSSTATGPKLTKPNIVGTATNDNAVAGSVGELIESEVLAGSAVALTTDVNTNMTSISLTAGDWDVWGNVAWGPNAATTGSYFQAAISIVSTTYPARPGKGSYFEYRIPTTAGNSPGISSVGMKRISLSGTTTVYLVVTSGFAVNTNSAYGYLGARRVR